MKPADREGKADQEGFGLVELLVALVLGLVLVLGVVQVFLAAGQTFALQRRVATLQEDARFALSRLASELRMVEMYGCINLSRLPEADSLPALLDTPISFSEGVLSLVTADPNGEVFAGDTTRAVSAQGATWLIATDCRSEFAITASEGVALKAGDILIPLRRVQYRVRDHQLQVRINDAGSFATLIEGVEGLDISFGLAATAAEPSVSGSYVESVDASDFNRIRSVRLALRLRDDPANATAARVATQEYTLVAALRNRME